MVGLVQVEEGRGGYRQVDANVQVWSQGSYNIPVTKFKVLLLFSRQNRIGKTLDLLRNACRSKHTFIGWRIM